MLPSEQGLAPSQASQYNIEPTIGNEQYVMRPSAAIYAENADNLTFQKNEVTRISNSVAVDYHHGVVNSSIRGNAIHQIAGTGGNTRSQCGTAFRLDLNQAGEIACVVLVTSIRQ
jgi:hypothetical protein